MVATKIIKLEATTPEYQYHLKDHLGNVRVTFTTKDEANTYTATFENNTQAKEQATFKNYTRVTNDLYDHTDAGTTYDKVQLLHGGNNSQVGTAKSLAVMPGDVVSAQVYALSVTPFGIHLMKRDITSLKKIMPTRRNAALRHAGMIIWLIMSLFL